MDSTSSKVTVEYHDPAGVFSLVSQDIASRLPLRNLNWQSSPARPLRQIKSLHLDLVPDKTTKDSLQSSSRTSGSGTPNGHTNFDFAPNGVDTKKATAKERRHQIPGLQTSPFLKIYVLRCDDKDTYKETERQKLREWIREETAAVNAKAKGKRGGENHDAFEWLILHIVVPDTVAASESRWRVSQKDADELKERKQGAKWPGKSTRTVFDKLRADFNESGKSAQDRIAQIRLLKRDLPADLLPTPPTATTLEETADEREKAWNDLMTKLKNLILEPFDRRVRQYEADIAEQEARRSLPGFNFCTFFIHKEGLAKALESIGLVEDALLVYDELSAGLDSVLRAIDAGNAEGTATTFAPYTNDIVNRITAPRKAHAESANQDVKSNEDDANLFDKDYRQKIVTSTISVFDFQCYMFARQRALILRLANTKAARARFGSNTKDGGEDFVLTSEVCWRASSFIHNAARVLRRDLEANNLKSEDWNGNAQDIENLVCSWTFVVVGMILEDTASTALDQAETDRRSSISGGSVTSPRRSGALSAGLGANSYPQRSTSLAIRKNRLSELQRGGSFKSASESEVTSPPSSSGTDGTTSTSVGGLPGMPELATYRAELIMVRRRMLEHVAKQRGWAAGWANLKNEAAYKLEDVELDGEVDSKPSRSTEPTKSPSSLHSLSPSLRAVLQNEAHFHALYEQLSDTAMRYYMTATQTKSAELIMGDLAIVKSQRGDFEYASRYFQHVLPTYNSDGWSLMEAKALRMHCKCLSALDRTEEYVRTSLTLLAKICAREKGREGRITRLASVDDDEEDANGDLLAEAIASSEKLSVEILSAAESFFSDIKLDSVLIRQPQSQDDGFSLRLRLEHMVLESLRCDAISARLVHHHDSAQEIWLTTVDSITLERGINEVDLATNTAAHGPFFIDRIVIQAKNLRFVQDCQPQAVEQPFSATSPTESPITPSNRHRRRWVLVYPPPQAFNVTADINPHIQVDQARSLQFHLESGWNEVHSIDLRLKPATAGLRLHLSDARWKDISRLNASSAPPGEIQLGPLSAHGTAQVIIPYSLEQRVHEISIRIEARYQTSRGHFLFISSAKVSTALLLDVNVKDVFHLDALISEFTVKTTTNTPLVVASASLDPSTVYNVEAPPISPMPVHVVGGHPVKLLYKTTRRHPDAVKASKAEAALKLSIDYHPVDELVIAALRRVFSKSLEGSDFAHLVRLITPLLGERAKETFSNADLELAALMNEIRMPTFGEFGWHEVVATLSPAERLPFTQYLQQIHNQNPRISLNTDPSTGQRARRIIVSVDVPHMDVVHRANLGLSVEALQHRHLPTLTLGQPVQAQLQLEHTRAWSANAVFLGPSPSDQQHQQKNSAFIYEVNADADTWLIGGQRRAQFTSEAHSACTFPIKLFPLRLGILPLPLVEVRSAATRVGERAARESHVLSVTQCASAGQAVQVIRDARTMRVEITEG